MTWIKICGTTSAEDASLALQAGADALGFIFAPSSRRIGPAAARDIVRLLPEPVEKIGVFVNEPVAEVLAVAGRVGLTAVQLHGDEDAGYARSLRSSLQQQNARGRVFKAIAVKAGFEQLLDEFGRNDAVDGVLLDSSPASDSRGRGGTGRTFDWNRAAAVLPGVSERVHVVIGGGLSPANVQHALQQLRPWGVDVCSGVEREPGKKDAEKVTEFVRAVRAADGRV